VNIYLIPYTHMRHAVMGLVLAAVGLVAWWVALAVILQGGPLLYHTAGLWWSQRVDTTLYLGTLLCAVCSASVFLEGALRRQGMGWRVLWSGLAAAVALLGWWAVIGLFGLVLPLFTGEAFDMLLADAAFVSLRVRIVAWVAAGVFSGLGPFVARRAQARFDPALSPLGWVPWAASLFSHVGGGAVAGALAAAVWHIPGHYGGAFSGDLYLGGAAAAAVFGGVHGLLCWPLPDDLYAGWIRVLSAERFGLRIPVPHADGSAAERFVGHFPRGLDVYLPAERGVAELHASFVVDDSGRYAVRGLSAAPTVVRRLLERIDLRFDPTRPAPLETGLRMEDRVVLGEAGETVVEFLMLPREEQ